MGGDSGAGSGRMRSRGGEGTDQAAVHLRGSLVRVLEGGLDVRDGEGLERGLTMGKSHHRGLRKRGAAPEGLKKQAVGQKTLRKAPSGGFNVLHMCCQASLPKAGSNSSSLNLVTCFPARVVGAGTVRDIRDEVTTCSAAPSSDSGAAHSRAAQHHGLRTLTASWVRLRPEMSQAQTSRPPRPWVPDLRKPAGLARPLGGPRAPTLGPVSAATDACVLGAPGPGWSLTAEVSRDWSFTPEAAC